MSSPLLAVLGVLLVFGALYWLVARPEAENGRWLWLFLTIGITMSAMLELVWLLASLLRRSP